MMLIIENLLTSQEVTEFTAQLSDAKWQDGLQTAKGLNTSAKRNQQTDPACQIIQKLVNHLLQKMGQHTKLISAALPHRIFPPVFNRYQLNQTYGAHVDAAIMQVPGNQEMLRSDVSMTLFLSPIEDYDGGELFIEGPFGVQEIRLNAGDAVLYPSSSLHQVNPVTRGERLAAITWIQSLVPDAEMRTLLFDLDQSIQSLTRKNQENNDELLGLTSVYHNLIRKVTKV